MSERKDKGTKTLLILIDFVKIRVLSPEIDTLLQLPFLDWKYLINEKTGEIEKHIVEFSGMTMEIFWNKYVYLSGSIHKYWNITNARGNQNYNDFIFSSLTWTIGDICDRLIISPVHCKIENIEFGVNLISPVPISELFGNLILHKRKPFNRVRRINRDSCDCEHSQYVIKFYDKGIMFDRINILRFENRAKKMERLNVKKNIGIYNLKDLLCKDKLLKLGDLLVEDFNDLLFYDDTIQEKDLTLAKRTILINGRNPKYWEGLNKTNPNYFPKKLNRFRELVEDYGNQNNQEMIRNLIVQKWAELLQSNSETVQVLTGDITNEITGIDHIGIKSIPVHVINVEDIPAGEISVKIC